MDRDEVEVHNKNAKKERGQYPAILTEQGWSIKALLHVFSLIVVKSHSQFFLDKSIQGGKAQ